LLDVPLQVSQNHENPHTLAAAAASSVPTVSVEPSIDAPSAGKSSLTVQFVENHFVESYYPTIENTFTRTIRYKNQEYTTEIIDTAGQDEYSILNSRYSIGIHGYMLVYSVASKQSFEMVKIIRDKVLNHLVIPPPPPSCAHRNA
jgi:hypothetical protein